MSERQMPFLAEPGAVIGRVTEEAAAATGGLLPPGTPVVAAGGDGQVFATGMRHMAGGLGGGGGGGGGSGGIDNEFLLTLGTSVVLSRRSQRCVLSPAFRTLLECDLDSGTSDTTAETTTNGLATGAGAGAVNVNGTTSNGPESVFNGNTTSNGNGTSSNGPYYRLESVLQSGTYLLRWFVESFAGAPPPPLTDAVSDAASSTSNSTSNSNGNSNSNSNSTSSGDGSGGGSEDTLSDFQAWDRAAAAVAPGCEGLLTVPHWWGCRFPDNRPSLRGATIGWRHCHGQAHMYVGLRCVVNAFMGSPFKGGNDGMMRVLLWVFCCEISIYAL